MLHAECALPLLSRLSSLGYRFVCVTPETHARVLVRAAGMPGSTLEDVFGWNRDFQPDTLPADLFQLLLAGGALESRPDDTWRCRLRVASVGHLLFVHSPFPTVESDAVFFGPDSYRFARAIRELDIAATRAVDLGCGSGVGGIVLSHCGALATSVVLADINERALELARINAAAAGVTAEVVKSDGLAQIKGKLDLIIANPPYLSDPAKRAYRDGGGAHGEALSVRFVREALARLARDGGGTLLLYTGAAMVGGSDPFWQAIRPDLERFGARHTYEELDPDVFSSELASDAYQDTERIAVVLLRATVDDGLGSERLRARVGV
jgi:methylase of polypeptide subunit release factors